MGDFWANRGFPLVTCAGCASWASPPPFSTDRVFRTMFSSCMAAPREANSFVSFSFSSRRMGGMGAGSRADPPPRMQKRWQGHQDSRRRRTKESKALAFSLTGVWREGRGDWGPKQTSLENSVIFNDGFESLLCCTLCSQLHFRQAA